MFYLYTENKSIVHRLCFTRPMYGSMVLL